MKKFSISIPAPCHENWDAMTPEKQGRYCDSCQKTVIDFSMMSDRQLSDFFKKPAASLCGRFLPGQMNRPIVVPAKPIPWLRYFFTIALPAFLISCKGNAQQGLQGKMVNTQQLKGDTIATQFPPPPAAPGMIMIQPVSTIVGKVMNTKNIKEPSHKRCSIQAIKNDSDKFSPPPFTYQPVKIKPGANDPDKMNDSTMVYAVAGGISFTPISRFNKTAPIPLIPSPPHVKPVSFLIYPNPVQRSSSITINAKSLEAGAYQLLLQTSRGQTVQQKELVIDNENSQLNVSLNSVTAGIYFVRLTNKKTGKIYTEKLMVQ